MTNYYEILGVNKDASQDQIKASFRKLAREHHPDKGGDTQQFQKIQQAYETLSDPQKRAQYDSPIPKHFGNNFANDFDFHFNTFFGGQQRAGRSRQQQVKKSDHFYNCKIMLRDIYFGTTKTIKVTRSKICKTCHSDCGACNGSGHSVQHIQMGPFVQVIQGPCNQCSGSGIHVNKNNECKECDDQCKIKEEKLIQIVIERGAPSEQQILVEGWGEQPTKGNEIAGNLIVNVTCSFIENEFNREGLDLLYKIKISLVESIVGKELTIPHFDGPLVINTKMFGIINPNNKYSIQSKGLVNKNGETGNLIVAFEIVYPEKKLNDNDISVLSDVFKGMNL